MEAPDQGLRYAPLTWAFDPVVFERSEVCARYMMGC